MKKYIPLTLLLIVLIGLFAYSVSFRDSREQAIITDNEISAVTTTAADDTLSDSDLIAQNEEGGYKLYYKNGIATVTYKDYGDAVLNFTGWEKTIDIKKPQLYYADFDSDSEKELLIKIVDNYEEILGKTEYTYALYFIEPQEKDGTTILTYNTAQDSTWKNVFSKSIKLEVTQLNECKKILQFAMNDAEEPIYYDEKTGITDNKYVSYALADCSDKKEYYTLESFAYGVGVYDIQQDNKITLDVQVIGKYKETEQRSLCGNIHCNITYTGGDFRIQPSTIEFIPLDERAVNDPRDTAQSSWSYTINNLSTDNGYTDTINTIDDTFTLENGTSSNKYFGSYTGGIKNVDKVIFTQSSVTLVAKQGCKFSTTPIDTGRFDVTVGNMDISYTAQIKGNSLIITFDKAYDKEDISSITVNFGI